MRKGFDEARTLVTRRRPRQADQRIRADVARLLEDVARRREEPADRQVVLVRERQRVDEEVHDVDAHAGAAHGVLVEQIATHHLGVPGPRHVAQLRGVADEAAHGVALGEQPGGQASADIAGGAGDEDGLLGVEESRCEVT